MEIEVTEVKKLRISGINGLDPVTAFFENFGKGRGKLTVSCFDKSWNSYWNAMGKQDDGSYTTLEQFILSCHTEYLVRNLAPQVRETVIDVDKTVKMFKDYIEEHEIKDVDDWEFEGIEDERDLMEVCYKYPDLTAEVLETDDWLMGSGFPREDNYRYLYVWKVVEALKAGINEK